MSSHPDPQALWSETSPDPRSRAAILEHLGGCSECRRAVADVRPELLLALLSHEVIPDEALDRLSARLDLALPRNSRHAGDRDRGLRWIPVAASLVLAGLVGAYVWQRGVEPSAGVRVGLGPIAPSVALGAIEVDEPGAAEVVNVQIGDTTVVMIFDEGFDL